MLVYQRVNEEEERDVLVKVTEESCRETSVQDFGGGTEGPFLGTSDLFGTTNYG